jgi:hypothetical protein
MDGPFGLCYRSRDKAISGRIRVAKLFSSKLFGGNGPGSIEAFRDTIMASPLGARSDGFIQELYRFLDRGGTAGATRAFAIPDPGAIAIDFDADARAQAALGPHGPQSGAEGGPATISVLVDWPWQIAVGLAPITPEWQALAQHEPTGWLENLLAQNALAAPVLIEFSAAEFAGALENSPFWADAARSGLGLSGDFSAGFTLTAVSLEVDRIMLGGGNDYNLATDDSLVAAGGRLVVEAGALGDGEHVMFDGSAETDGSFVFLGSESSDLFLGGAGRDWIMGAGGADTLSGGGGGDVFVYTEAGESSGASHDTLADFDPVADRIDLPGSVSGFAATVTTGTLSTASFDADLSALVSGLGPGRAVWVAPNAGTLAGTIFLVVDGNGASGYQAGDDYVFAVGGSPLVDLTGHTNIFI